MNGRRKHEDTEGGRRCGGADVRKCGDTDGGRKYGETVKAEGRMVEKNSREVQVVDRSVEVRKEVYTVKVVAQTEASSWHLLGQVAERRHR